MLFDKFKTMAAFREELQERDVVPFGAVTERLISSTEAIVSGREVILAGTNNYLGLSYDERCIEAARLHLEARFQVLQRRARPPPLPEQIAGAFDQIVKIQPATQGLGFFIER